MFKNEVLVEKSDKKRLIELINEANSILEKYEYSADYNCHTVTVIAKAKNFVKEALKWCKLLYAKE